MFQDAAPSALYHLLEAFLRTWILSTVPSKILGCGELPGLADLCIERMQLACL